MECFDWTKLPERDVKLTEAMEMLENYPENQQFKDEVESLSKADPFYSTLKISVSLPGLTKRYLF